MTEQQRILIEVQREISVNTKNIKAATVSATMCEVNIKTYQKRLLKLDDLHKKRMNSVQKGVDRYVRSLKDMHKTLDELLIEKEALHVRLTDATHFGKEQCDWCKNYFTPTGLPRHKSACASKPVNKIVKKHKAEIVKTTDDIEARKEALKKQLADLEGK